jgi:hypothetical protein
MPKAMDGDAATARGRGASTFWIGLDVGERCQDGRPAGLDGFPWLGLV